MPQEQLETLSLYLEVMEFLGLDEHELEPNHPDYENNKRMVAELISDWRDK